MAELKPKEKDTDRIPPMACPVALNSFQGSTELGMYTLLSLGNQELVAAATTKSFPSPCALIWHGSFSTKINRAYLVGRHLPPAPYHTGRLGPLLM